MILYALVVSVCLSNGQCYDVSPEVYEDMARCVIEATHQDSWQTAELQIAKVGLNRAQLDRDLAQLVSLIENDFRDITLTEVKNEFYI